MFVNVFVFFGVMEEKLIELGLEDVKRELWK